MLQAAAIFSDNMVLQRNKKIRVFGTADSGSRITVSLLNQIAETECRDGKWKVYLPELEKAEGAEMVISDGTETICFTNIAIGEVWLAGGQSNMELELQNADGGAEILKNGLKESDILKNIRFYYTPKVAYECETLYAEERKSHWELFSEKDAAKWSAVGFFFAKELAEKFHDVKEDVTIGIIGCNWGGTSASAWMSREALLEQEATESYVEEYENSQWVKKSRQEQIQDYEDYLIYHADWEKRAAQVYEKEPMMPFDRVQEIVGPCKYPGPMNCANFTRPYGLYESMLKRIMPYTLRGFIYYQGESDDHKPESYYALFTRMIRQWREDFEEETLPFLMVQLPMHRYQHDPDTKNWCIIREAQMKAYHMVKNTGIAVIIDCGQFHEIHPKNKKPVGYRLALQALWQVYHLIPEKAAFGPIYKDFLYRDGGMEISFQYEEDGFSLKGELSGFEIAGADEKFYPAKAVVLLNKNTVFLSSEEVKQPVMARYLWTNYGEITLFGANGLPAAPFRTHIFAS
ncbi:MAG: sialate O-acetylesterase [Lachnospiraceae bacterium]|nr:sialate O-acetylesterase [Lachnospiraceae bacterium]